MKNSGNTYQYTHSNLTQEAINQFMDELQKKGTIDKLDRLWIFGEEYIKPISNRQINKLNKELNKLYKELDKLI